MQSESSFRPAVRGAGGKGGGGGASVASDTLRSTQIADIVDLLGEGEIEGLVHGLQSIYLDGVPLQNADGSFNFEGVQVAFTPGTQGQASITGADGVQSEAGVGVEVTVATPVVRTITNPAVDKVRVTIAVPQLSDTNTSTGDLRGSSFQYAIDVQSNGGGYVEALRDIVQGKTMSRYTRSKVLTLAGAAPWNVRVRRLSADATGGYVVNAFSWASYTEIQSLKLRHPNSALVRTRANAQQFSRIPARGFHLRALRMQVPTNYDPMTKTYSGVWDGSFKIAWTDCPAWMYYAAVSNNRFGLGRYFNAGPNLKWQMYRIGRNCDEMVSDGRGGQEPRFRAGVVLATREQAYKVLTDLAGIFRGMTYWANSEVAVTQDAPADAIALFTPANVVGGKFTYSGASLSKRPSQVTVWFNDLQQQGKLVPEVVRDRDFERRYGVRPKELSPLGVWSRAQARRVGLWALFSEQYEGELVSFRVGLDGVLVPPGAIFEVADPNEAGERLGGRVHSATAAAVTLDKPVTLAAGESYTLSVMLPDAADATKLVAQKRAVTTAAGAAATLTVSPAFSAAPAAQTVWLLQSDAVQATSWRCLACVEAADSNEHEITAVRHFAGKYALIEQGIAFERPPVSRIRAVPPAVASLAFTETVYALGQERRSRVTISWPEPAAGLAYLLSWRLANGPWTDMPATTANCVDVDALPPGLLEVTVKARNGLGALSAAKAGSLTVVGNQVRIGSNLIDPTWWQPGAAMEWMLASDVAGESSFVWDAGPRGTVQALWQCVAAGPPNAGPDGGWDANDSGSAAYPKNQARVDPLRTYRFAVPVMRLSGAGPVFFGPAYQDPANAPASWTRVCDLNTSNPSPNPYFHAGSLPSLGRWYLLVAFVFPAGSSGVAGDAGGVFDMLTGERVASTTNFCWTADARTARTRAFQYYATTGATLRFAPPTVELVDGTEGSWQAGPRGIGSTTLIARGQCTTPAADKIKKVGGVDRWDSDCYSLESFVNGAWCSFQADQTTASFMVGLNSDPALVVDPTANYDYATLDFAWYCTSLGTLQIYESATYRGDFGTYDTSTVLSVTYDGAFARYFKNGTLSRQVAASSGQRLFLDSSFNTPGAVARNVRFGPAGAAGSNGTNGVDGVDGEDGKFVRFVWKRAATQPATPTGNGVPSTWSDDPPAGTGPLWMSKAKQELDGTTIGAWAAPIRHDGPPGTNGIDGINGQDGKLVRFVWKRAATQPAAPTGSGVPSGWSDDPPSGLEPLWMSKAKQELDGSLIGAWSTPVRHDGPPGVNGIDGIDGEDGKLVRFVWKRAATQPAAPAGNGVPSGWSDDPPGGTGALWMSKSKQELDGTLIGAWSTPIRHDGTPGTNGIDGVDGEDGKLVRFVWKRAATQPAAPTGNGVPSGWSDDPPGGTEPLWMSKSKQELDGTLIGAWSTPIRHDGPAGAAGAPGVSSYTATVYIQAGTAPASPTGGSYTFSTSSLVPPSGWSATQPVTTTTPTYAVDFRFSTTTPNIAVAGGAWTTPVMIAVLPTPPAGPVVVELLRRGQHRNSRS